MTRTLKTPEDLIAAGLAAANDIALLEQVAERYAISVPPSVLPLIEPENPLDPIARQYVPSAAELAAAPHETSDPIGDAAHSPVAGIVHRYPSRVLFKVTSVCPVYCRFCFRREHVGPGQARELSAAQRAAALEYIRSHPQIMEVILTGGDPLMLSAARAGAITRELEKIPHVSVIRWHTRMPVADPARISADYVDALASPVRAVFLAVHVNHARELTPEAHAALRRLREAGITLVSQSVLLRGVNDTVQSLSSLMNCLLAAGVKPYYLHHLDAAPGTAHFRVPIEEGQALVRALRDQVSGLAVPHYVVDIPGGLSKASLALSDTEYRADGLAVRGRDSAWHYLPGEA